MATSSDRENAGKKTPSSLDEYSDRLDRMRGEPEPERQGQSSGTLMGKALRASSDLLAGFVVGGLIGYGLDRWLGTSPWLLLLGLGVGFAAGMRNLMRTVR